MRAVGVKALKDRLSEYLRLVAAGEAVRKGWLRPPLRRGEGPPPRAPVAPLEVLLAELGRDREDR